MDKLKDVHEKERTHFYDAVNNSRFLSIFRNGPEVHKALAFNGTRR